MNNSIKFTGLFPDGLKEVELSNPDGGGEGYHIYVDRYYQGALHHRNGAWVAFLNDRSRLDRHQTEVLGQIIDLETGAGLAPTA